jgi:hypothetical protein
MSAIGTKRTFRKKGVAPKGNIALVITKPKFASSCGSGCATFLKRDLRLSVALASTGATTANPLIGELE